MFGDYQSVYGLRKTDKLKRSARRSFLVYVLTMSKVPLPEERILFKGHPAVIGSMTRLLVAVLTLGIGAIWFWLKSTNI